MAKNRGIEHFFQHWARNSLHLLSLSIAEVGRPGNPCEDKMPALYFFLDSLSHHYINALRTTALGEAVEYLKCYCTDYPQVTKGRSEKALFLARYLYKVLGLERNFAFAQAQENNPASILTERRSSERHPLIATVRFRIKDTEDWTPSRIVNISESGLRLEANCRLGAGERLQVEILSDSESRFVLEVQTIWMAAAPLRPALEYGLQLAGSTAEAARKKLSSLIHEKSLQERLFA